MRGYLLMVWGGVVGLASAGDPRGVYVYARHAKAVLAERQLGAR